MNKKFSTLVAVLLAAGAWTTLDAKVIKVAAPAVGQAVVIGSNLEGTGAEGSEVIYLAVNGYAAELEGAVAAATATWELETVEQTTFADAVASEYYLKTTNGEGEVVYLLQAEAQGGGGSGVSLRSGETYTYSVGEASDLAEGTIQAVVTISFTAEANRIQVKEGEEFKNLVFGDDAISVESDAGEANASPELKAVEFGYYVSDAHDKTPGFDLQVDDDGQVMPEALLAGETYDTPVYFKADAGYLIVEGDKVNAISNIPTSAQALSASWRWVKGKLVSLVADSKSAQLQAPENSGSKSINTDYTLAATGTNFAGEADLSLYVSSATAVDQLSSYTYISGTKNIVTGSLELLESVPSGYAVVSLQSGSAGTKVTQYLKAGASATTVTSITASSMTEYENYLWKVSEKNVNGDIYYTFTSLAKDNAGKAYVWTVDSNSDLKAKAEYSENGILLTAGGNDILTNGATSATSGEVTAVIGFYQSFVLAHTESSLDNILNPGFDLTVKYEEKVDKTIENISVFQQKMYPTSVLGSDVAVELWNTKDHDAKKLVLDTKGTVGSDVTGEFKWLTEKEIQKGEADQYKTAFQFQYAQGASNVITKLVIDGKSVSILFNDNKYYLTTSSRLDAKLPYIKLGASNVYDVKKLLGQYLSFAYADTKANTQEVEEYKLNGLLTLVYDATANMGAGAVVADFAQGTSTSLPEAQWAVTKANTTQNTVTLTNRENTSVSIDGVKFRAEGNKFVMIVSGNDNITDDLVTMTVTSLDKTTGFDGFMQTTPNVLRNENFYLGQYHAIEGNNNAYFVENHTEAGSHQIGMTAEKENAQKWNLHFATKKVDNSTLVDTVFVPITFATLKDGNIITAGDDAVKDTLFILPYAFQNASNREFVSYKTGKGFDYYFCNKDKTTDANDAAVIKFALKMKPDNTYNFVEIASKALSANKVLAGNSANKGILSRTGTYVYDQNENSLMVVEKADAPEYHKIAAAWGDTISLFREENNAQVVYEKRDAKSVVEKDTLSFLNIDNINQFDVNPAIFADTAYINRTDANGELNTCYQYLLAVNVDPDKSYYCPYNPEHNTDEWRKEHNGPCADAKENRAVAGRFLVNLIDTANVYGVTHLHNNPYINNVEAAENLAKLSFVQGVHIGDTLIITRKGGEAVKLRMDTPDFNVAKFAFRYMDSDAKTFKIQTQYKPYAPGVDAEIIDGAATDGYLKWVNGTLVVTDSFDKGDVFGIEENYEGDPVANESIDAPATVSVIAGEGQVVIKGAAGKTVVISNVLGQTIANTVLSSDNATIAAPAGVVVVAVEGEAAVKAIVK